jgi:hypothetical protein
MSETSSEREQRLERVLADYLHAIEAGTAPDRAELRRQHPDLAAELGSFFRNRDDMERMAAGTCLPGTGHSTSADRRCPWARR